MTQPPAQAGATRRPPRSSSRKLWDALPRGGSLPESLWRRRHRGILILLWLHVPWVAIFAVAAGESVAHGLVESAGIASLGSLATLLRKHRAASTLAAAVGLLSCSAVLVHLSGGLIEMHFHYFVMVAVVTLYQDWTPFLVAIGYVVLQHGVIGALDPRSVYNHAAAVNHPWEWAGIHGLFILGMSTVGVVSWRLNERLLSTVSDRESQLAEAQELAMVGSWEWDVASGRVVWSDEMYRLLGAEPGEFEPSLDAFVSRVHADDRQAVAVAVWSTVSGSGPFSQDFRILSPDGSTRWLHARGALSRSAEDSRELVSVSCQDITDRRRYEDTLKETLSLLHATLDSTADGILVVDNEGRITSFNRQFLEMWRIPPSVLEQRDDERALGFVIEQLADPDRFVAKVKELYSQPDAESTDLITFKDGRLFERHSKPQRVGGVAVGRVWSFRDVTERKQLEDELAHQAFHDALTGLANQALFRDRVDHALARARRSGEDVAVMFLDLDNFKMVNDSLGHPVGDELLVAVAKRLESCLPDGDTAARLGGDEFAVLLEGANDRADVLAVADRVLEAMGRSLAVSGKEVVCGASIGIAFSDADALDSAALLRNADMAMYKAKGSGKGRAEVFEPSMHVAAVERLHLEADLRGAVAREEFEVVYQPMVELATGAFAGVEALVRWRHPERGMLLPGTFVGIAEETGLITEIGHQVLRQATTTVRSWQVRFPAHAHLFVSVNLSPSQLSDAALRERVGEALRASGLPPSGLVLEITEGAMVRPEATPRLAELRDLGVLLAVDDFGTGYSSLSYLQRLPIDLLKIDQSFIATMGRGPEDAALPRAVVQLAHVLQLRAIAEGVETPEQAEQLGRWGCHMAQGYLFARPQPAGAIEELLLHRPGTATLAA